MTATPVGDRTIAWARAIPAILRESCMHLCPGLQFQVLYLYPDSQRITAGQSMVFRLYASCIDPYSSLHSTLDWTLAGCSSDATSRLKLRRYRTVCPSCRLAAAARLCSACPASTSPPRPPRTSQNQNVQTLHNVRCPLSVGTVGVRTSRRVPLLSRKSCACALQPLSALPYSKPHHRHIVVTKCNLGPAQCRRPPTRVLQGRSSHVRAIQSSSSISLESLDN